MFVWRISLDHLGRRSRSHVDTRELVLLPRALRNEPSTPITPQGTPITPTCIVQGFIFRIPIRMLPPLMP